MATSSISAALAAVVQERERLQQEIRSLEAQLTEVDAAIASLDRIAHDGASRAGARSTGLRGRPAGRRAQQSDGTRASGQGRTTPTMVALIESYLDEQGRAAIHADQILDHLRTLDRAPSGKNPKATLQTTLAQLQKRGRVKNIGKNRWRLVRTGITRNGTTASDNAEDAAA